MSPGSHGAEVLRRRADGQTVGSWALVLPSHLTRANHALARGASQAQGGSAISLAPGHERLLLPMLRRNVRKSGTWDLKGAQFFLLGRPGYTHPMRVRRPETTHPGHPDDDLAVTRPVTAVRPVGSLKILLMGPAGVARHELPGPGSAVIGRGEGCDICFKEPSLSRKHARMEVGKNLVITDLGSANGTRVRGRRLEANVPTEIQLGEPIELGGAILVVQRGGEPNFSDTAIVSGAFRQPGQGRAQTVIEDPATRHVYDLATRVADSALAVLIVGETGVGKELLAEAIHRASRRAQGPFLQLNCASLSESLLGSELFGHEKGAFTGATRTKPGLFEIAAGGTVFLDEIGELPMHIQVSLLRVLEERKTLRVGGLKPIPIDARFVAATNRDLRQEIERGTFRRDLYFRLNGVTLEVPPLRERRGEIAALARMFVAHSASEQGLPTSELSPEALAALQRYLWPGNVRELRNAMGRAVLLCGGGPIKPEHLPDEILASAPPAAAKSSAPAPRQGEQTGGQLKEKLDALEREGILDALNKCGGNQTRAAELLGVSRRTLVNRLKAYGVPRPRG